MHRNNILITGWMDHHGIFYAGIDRSLWMADQQAHPVVHKRMFLRMPAGYVIMTILGEQKREQRCRCNAPSQNSFIMTFLQILSEQSYPKEGGGEGAEEQSFRELQYTSARSASVQSTNGEERQPCIDSHKTADGAGAGAADAGNSRVSDTLPPSWTARARRQATASIQRHLALLQVSLGSATSG